MIVVTQKLVYKSTNSVEREKNMLDDRPSFTVDLKSTKKVN